MKIIKGNLIMKEDMTFDEDLKVEGSIFGENGNRYNLAVKGDLNCLDLDCRDLNCLDLKFYAVAIAYNSFKCKFWEARRENYIINCLDGEIEIKDKKYCDKCGQELKGEKEE